MKLARVVLLLSALLLVACGNGRLPQLDLDGSAMGTTFNISIVTAPGSLDEDMLQTDIVAALARVDELASTWRDDSELSAFNAEHSTDWITVSPEFCTALNDALQISRSTNGAFDVTVGPAVNLWGFGPTGQVSEPPSDAAVEAAMQSVGYGLIEVDCDEGLVRKDAAGMYVDLSGWAKGLAVDEVAQLLESKGIENYLVEIGGELRAKGHNSANADWAIAIEAPSMSRRIPQAIIHITDTGVATSGDYRNFFEYAGEHYSHAIDPRTGRPVTHDLAAVTVLAASTAYADAMATGLLVLGPDAGPALARDADLAAYFLMRDTTGIREVTTPEFDRIAAL